MKALLYSKSVIAKAAQSAIESPPPPSGSDYTFLQQLQNDYDAHVTAYEPFAEEKKRATFVFVVGMLAAVLAPLGLGWTNLSAFLILAGGFTAFVGGFEAFFKRWPAEVTHDTIDQSRRQLEEAGETGQRLTGPVAKVLYGVLCMADGALAGTALAERLGQASLTPRMAMAVGLVFSIALAAALFSSIKAAAREAQKQNARKMIRNLQASDPAKAKAMETRIGDKLGFGYGSRDDSIKARCGLILLTAFMAFTQLGLRLGGFADDANGMGNIFNWIAGITVSALIFFTVGGLYFAEHRCTFIDEDSPHSKTVLSKFPDHASVDKQKAKHANKLKQAAQKTIHKFAHFFHVARTATNAAKTHPTPTLAL